MGLGFDLLQVRAVLNLTLIFIYSISYDLFVIFY